MSFRFCAISSKPNQSVFRMGKEKSVIGSWQIRKCILLGLVRRFHYICDKNKFSSLIHDCPLITLRFDNDNIECQCDLLVLNSRRLAVNRATQCNAVQRIATQRDAMYQLRDLDTFNTKAKFCSKSKSDLT